MQAGWLEDVTNWLREAVRDVWASFVAFVADMLLALLALVMEAFALLVEALPVPAFLEGASIGGYLANLPGGVQWMLATFQLPACFGLLASGVAFRLIRKLITLGQW